MLPALLAQIGIPVLARLVGGALGGVEHPAAKAASEALGAVDRAVADGGIRAEDLAESNRHVERLAELDADTMAVAYAQVNTTMRTEARAEDAYVRRWRPTFGYVVALAWGGQMAALSWAIVATPADVPAIVTAMGSLSIMWGIALSVLGVAVHQRSRDKALAAGTAPEGGLAGLIGRAIGAGR